MHTIVSVYPQNINEVKPGLFPNSFTIPASDGENPQILVIGDKCFRTKEIPLEENPEQRVIRIPVDSKVVAHSVVYDFIQASRFSNEETVEDAHPGLAYLEGELSADEVVIKHEDLLENLVAKQKNWFRLLLHEADDMWQSFHLHRMMDAMHRMAADQLKEDREWMKKPASDDELRVKTCQFCTNVIPMMAVKCPRCLEIVDVDGYESLKIKSA